MEKMKELSGVLDRTAACGECLLQEAEKLRLLMPVIDGLAECGRMLIPSGTASRGCFPDTEAPAKASLGKNKPAMEQDAGNISGKVLGTEDVRRILAKASQAGHRREVTDLLIRYGAYSISSLSPEIYVSRGIADFRMKTHLLRSAKDVFPCGKRIPGQKATEIPRKARNFCPGMCPSTYSRTTVPRPAGGISAVRLGIHVKLQRLTEMLKHLGWFLSCQGPPPNL